MTDLFRFVALRAPARELPKDSVDLSAKSPLQTELAVIRGWIAAGQRFSPIKAAQEIVEQFIKGVFGPGLITDSATIPEQAAFEQFAAAAATAKDVQELATAIQAA